MAGNDYPQFSLFAAHVRGVRSDALGAPTDIEVKLTGVLETAKCAWPDIDLPADVFIRHLACHMSGDALPWLGRVRADELYLACACACGVPSAVQAFDRVYLSQTRDLLTRLLPARGLAEEVGQLIAQQLLAATESGPGSIASYGGEGRLRGWLRVMTVREALRAKSKARREPLREDGAPELEAVDLGNPELRYMTELYREEFREAFSASMTSLTPRERTLLRHAFIDGLTVDEIGAIYRVHRATAARWVASAREHLAAATREAFTARLRIEAPEQESILRFIESQLDISVRRYLDAAG